MQKSEIPTAILLMPHDLDQIIKAICSQVEAEVSKIRTHMIEKPMSAKEAAGYLKITPKTLSVRISKGVIPADLVHRVEGSTYFFPSELAAFIKKPKKF
jgi:hypothetical protein